MELNSYKKNTGDLLRHEDWDGLIDSINSSLTDVATVQAALTTSVNNLSNTVASVTTTLAMVVSAQATITNQIKSIFDNTCRLTLKTQDAKVTVGLPTIIIAKVYSLDGQALNFTDVGTRPWIDFVTPWGMFHAAPGYESVSSEGAGSRSMSVQVNANGEAQVQLNAGELEDISDGDHKNLVSLLQTKPQNSTSNVSQIIMNSNNASEAKNSGAFSVVNLGYNNKNSGIRAVGDSYFAKNLSSFKANPGIMTWGQWRDYRTTVFAFVKNDPNPTTADTSRGSASTQVIFRDWIASWIFQGYFDDITDLTNQFNDLLKPKISLKQADFQKAVQDLLDTFVKDTGILERQKKYWAAKKVFDTLNLPNPPDWFSKVLKAMSDAITLQVSVDLSSSITATGTSVFAIIAGTSLDAGAAAETVQSSLVGQITAVQQQATQLGQSISSVLGQIGSMNKQISEVSSQVAVHEGNFKQIDTLHSRVSSVQNQVSALQNFKVLDIPVDVKNLQTELGSLWTAVNNIKK